MKTKELKCQCPVEGKITKKYKYLYTKEELKYINHKPNKCKNKIGLKIYLKDGKEMLLCSCCHLSGDVLAKGN